MTQQIVKDTERIIKESSLQNPSSSHSKNFQRTSSLKKNERATEILRKLLEMLEEKKIYLDAHLNLYGLSLLLCTNTTYLSTIINRNFGCNLKTLLNKYRVEYAKELLEKNKCNAQELPPLCGFTSRSTFYAVFTKFEHVTPIEYRQQYQSSEMMKQIEEKLIKKQII